MLKKNSTNAIIIVLSFLVFSAYSQDRKGEKRFLNPEGLSKPTGYTHVVISGGTVYISGQVSRNEKGELVGKGDLRAQLTQVYDNLRICLTAAGLTFEDVVRMNLYVVNFKTEDALVIRDVRKNYITGENPPASTLVGVTALANPDFMVEIDAIARMK